MRLSLITSYLLLVTSSLAQVAQIPWDVQQDRPVPHDVGIWRGETVDLMPRLVQGTRPVAVTNAPVELRYREAALATNQYRSVAGAANTNSGVLAVRWLPDYDAGAAWYDYQVIVGSNAANPRAFGRITMRGTIGLPGPNEPPPPITLHPTRGDLQAASNALASALQHALTSSVPSQISSATQAVASAASQAASNIVTAAIDALPPAPTGVPVWRDTVNTNIFGTLERGTGMVWEVTSFTNWALISSGNQYPVVAPYPIPDANAEYDIIGYPDKLYVLTAYDSGGWPAFSLGDPNINGFVLAYSMPLYSDLEVAGAMLVAPHVETNFVTRMATTNDLALLLTANSLEEWWDMKQAEMNNLYYSRQQADARYLSATPGWFWQGSQQVETNAYATNYLGMAMLTNSAIYLIPSTPVRHDLTGSVSIVSQSQIVGISYGSVTPETGSQPILPMGSIDYRTSPTSWVVEAWCSPNASDAWSVYVFAITNLAVYGYDRLEMSASGYTNDAAGIIARVDDAEDESDLRRAVNFGTMKAYVDSRKIEIADAAWRRTPGGRDSPSANIVTIDQPLVQQGAISYLNSGDYYCMTYEGGDWYSSSTGSVWRIGPSGRVSFEIASTNRMLLVSAFRVTAGNALITIATNWVVGTPSIEFTDNLAAPQWVSCPAQTMSNAASYWAGACPAVAGTRFFRVVDPSGDNVIRSHVRHEFLMGFTLGTNTIRNLTELKAALDALP